MSISSSVDKIFRDDEYEKGLCKELLDISRLMYATVPSKNLPTASMVMSEKKNQTSDQVREQIKDNLVFLRTTYKYMLFDLEATRRERDASV